MPNAIVYRDGKPIRVTVLTSAQAESFVILANAVSAAQNIMRNHPELDIDGRTLKGATHDANASHTERHPDDIYAVLPRLAELLGKHARAVYPHLDQSVNGEVMREANGAPEHGLKLVNKNTPVPAPFHPAAALAGQASVLGMIPLDGLAFDYSELVDPPPAGSGVPQVRAYVRWRA